MRNSRQSQSNLQIISPNGSKIKAEHKITKKQAMNSINKNDRCSLNQKITVCKSRNQIKSNEQREVGSSSQQIRKNILSHLETQASDIYQQVFKKNSNLSICSPQFYHHMKSSNPQKRIRTEHKRDSRLQISSMLKNHNQLNLLEIFSKGLKAKISPKKQSQEKEDELIQKQKLLNNSKEKNGPAICSENQEISIQPINFQKAATQEGQNESQQKKVASKKETNSQPNNFTTRSFHNLGSSLNASFKKLPERNPSCILRINHSNEQLERDISPLPTSSRSNRYKVIEGQIDYGLNLQVKSPKTLKKLLTENIEVNKVIRLKRVKTQKVENQMKGIYNLIRKNTLPHYHKPTIIERIKTFQNSKRPKCREAPTTRKQGEQKKNNENIDIKIVINSECKLQKQNEKIPSSTMFIKSFKKSSNSPKKNYSLKKFHQPKKSLKKKISQNERRSNLSCSPHHIRQISPRKTLNSIPQKTKKSNSLQGGKEGESFSGWLHHQSNQIGLHHRDADLFMDEQHFSQYVI